MKYKKIIAVILSGVLLAVSAYGIGALIDRQRVRIFGTDHYISLGLTSNVFAVAATRYGWINGVPVRTENTNFPWVNGVPYIIYEYE